MSGEYWEDLYQKGETGWDKGEPSPGLVDFLELRAPMPGRVLIPGCGKGHDVVAWGKAGFDAVGFDIAPSAVGIGKGREDLKGLKIDFKQGDFLRDPVFEEFDLIFEHTLFCAIQPEERELYEQAVARCLKPGGFFVSVHYMIPDEDGPPFGTTRDEVVERFEKFLRLEDEWEPRSYPNRKGLERMFLWQKCEG